MLLSRLLYTWKADSQRKKKPKKREQKGRPCKNQKIKSLAFVFLALFGSFFAPPGRQQRAGKKRKKI
jgi:hypothetical protein